VLKKASIKKEKLKYSFIKQFVKAIDFQQIHFKISDNNILRWGIEL